MLGAMAHPVRPDSYIQMVRMTSLTVDMFLFWILHAIEATSASRLQTAIALFYLIACTYCISAFAVLMFYLYAAGQFLYLHGVREGRGGRENVRDAPGQGWLPVLISSLSHHLICKFACM